MTNATKRVRRAAPLPAATLAALLLAGCSSGHIGESWQCPLRRALRALSHADHAQVAVPLADDAAGAGYLPAHRLQPDGAVLGAVGNAPRTAGLGRELRLPAVEEALMLSPLTRRAASAVVAALIGALLLSGWRAAPACGERRPGRSPGCRRRSAMRPRAARTRRTCAPA